MERLKIFICLIAGAGLAACSSTAPPDLRTLNVIDEALLDARASNLVSAAPSRPPEEISNALLPPIQLNLPEHSGIDIEPRFDIKVDRANAREFFMGLVEGTPYNMVVHPEVKGQITLNLKNVTIDEVMQVVRNVYGLDYERTRTAYHVYADIIRTRIFKLDYLAVKRTGGTTMRVSSGQVTQTAQQNSGSSNSSDNNRSDVIRDTLATSSLDTSSVSDFWSEIRESLGSMVGNEGGRSVVVSPQSGVIVVRAMPSELRAVETYLKDTQTVMHRQVLLEAKVIEVTLSDGFQSGINWAALKDTGSSSVLLGQTGGGSIFTDGSNITDGNLGDLNPGNLAQVNGTITSAFGGVFSAALNIKSNFAAFIELLKTQGDVQVLSSPQVATMNNQKAVIKVGTDEFYITDIESNTDVSSATSNTRNDIELTPFFSGVALDVIPQISENNLITLHIHPTVVDVTEKVKSIDFANGSATPGDRSLNVPLAVSTVRETDTVIQARNGQVVIIGGLMKTKTSEEYSSVPFFGDIPLIGNLFKHTRELTTKSELVILLKPTVIEGPQQWVDGLERTRANLQRMVRKGDDGTATGP